MTTIQPYYQHNGITIYHGDCLDVMPTLEAGALVQPETLEMPRKKKVSEGWMQVGSLTR